MTSVIHIRDSNGTKDEVYIGRAGKGHDGYFGNPVAAGRRCPMCSTVHTRAGDTLPCYRTHLRERLTSDAAFRARVKGLHGMKLVCFCFPRPCHGTVLGEAAAALQGR